MKLRYHALLCTLTCFLSFSVFAAPLTHHDEEILEQLHLADIEALTQESFKDLISQAQLNGKQYALAVVRDTSGDKNFFYDLVSLFSAIETNKKFENPINRQPIISIRIYLLSNQPHFYGPEGGRLKQYHPSKGPMNLSRKPWLEGNTGDDFVGELHAKPQEGFYKYLKKHGIETTGFIEPWQHYSPTNLPTDIEDEELRAIIRGDYPLPLETRQAATLLLADILMRRETSVFRYRLPEYVLQRFVPEVLLQTIIDNQDTSPAIWDKAAFLLTQFIAFKNDRLNQLRNEQKQNAQNMLPTMRRLLRPDSTLDPVQKIFSRRIYLSFQVLANEPVRNIKATALSIMLDNSIAAQHKLAARNTIKNDYTYYKDKLFKNTFSTLQEREWAQQFINTFPNGEIIP
jgi:hypothetical protein